ncbi:MAG TPA: DUF1559 domain-containing protein [Pirellulales bacterium]|jgi:hypothetical protein|nr:DUF1559 domain-containing protein [Pirellulales bacterium]
MSIRRRIACGLFVCGALALAVWQAHASNQGLTRGEAALQAGLVPDDAFFAMSVHPRRVLMDKRLAKFDLKDKLDFADMARDGFNPWQVEEMVFFIGPPQAPQKPNLRNDVQHAMVIRLATATPKTELAGKILRHSKVEEAEIAGHKYFRAAKDPANPQRFNREPVICFLSDQVFIVADEPWLEKILTAKNATSPLITALATVDPDAEGTILYANTDGAKQSLLNELPPIGGAMQPIVEALGALESARLSVYTDPQISFRLSLSGADEAAADKLAQGVKDLQQRVKQQLLPILQMAPPPGAPEETRQAQELGAKVVAKIADGLVPQKSGKHVTVKIDDVCSVESVVEKLILPQAAAERKTAERYRKTNNLRQLGLALLNCESADGHFPPHAIFSKAGKPLLSWRVYALQYLDEGELFKQFHLDEPWDSEHNKPLIAKMPEVFKTIGSKPLAEGHTRYVVPVGKDTIFDGDKGVSVSQITDGTWHTVLILAVGEDKSVVWTKPDDLDFDPQKPLAGLGKIDDGGIPACFADCHVQNLRKTIDAETFRRLILRNDGKSIDQSKL